MLYAILPTCNLTGSKQHTNNTCNLDFFPILFIVLIQLTYEQIAPTAVVLPEAISELSIIKYLLLK